MALNFTLAEEREYYCPEDPNHREFGAHASEHTYVTIDEDGYPQETIDWYDSEVDYSTITCRECECPPEKVVPDWENWYKCGECGEIFEEDIDTIFCNGDGLIQEKFNRQRDRSFCGPTCAPSNVETCPTPNTVGIVEVLQKNLMKDVEETKDPKLTPRPFSLLPKEELFQVSKDEPWIKETPVLAPMISRTTGEPHCPCNDQEQMAGHRPECQWIVWRMGG